MGSRKVIYVIVIFLLVISIISVPVVVGEDGDRKCTWTDDQGRTCNEPVWGGSDEYCIFHDPDPNKDRDIFLKELKDRINEGNYDFSGFVFPTDIDFSEKTFIGADFSNAVFEGETLFNHTIFKGKTIFYNATFKKKAEFNNTKFKAFTQFIETTFERVVNFNETVFELGVLFDKSKFRNGANFDKPIFHEHAGFEEAKFFKNEKSYSNVRFSEAHFKGSANFRNAIFHDRVSFNGTVFEQAAEFSRDIVKVKEDTFQSSASFYNVTFGGYTNFSNVIFDDSVSFEHAIFGGYTLFESVKFKEGSIRFKYAEFWDEIYFDNAEFNEIDGYTCFSNVIFEDYTYFQEVIFSGEVYFDDAKFRGVTNFDFAEFKGEKTWFYPTFFENDVYFNNIYLGNNPEDWVIFKVNFEKKAIFDPIIDCKLDIQEFSVSGFAKIELKGLKLDNIGKIIVVFGHVELIGANLTGTKFKDAYLENVNFVKCEWPDPFIIYEESTEYKKSSAKNPYLYPPLKYEDLETIYRNLKISFQKYGQSDLAGKAFYREMEMRRKGTCLNSPLQWLWLHFIWLLCGYGETPWRIVFWSLIVIFGFAGLFYKYRINVEDHFYLYFQDKVKYSKFCLLFSIASFSTLGTRYIKPKGNASRWLSAIESLIGAFFIALFIYVFARKMLR